MKHSKMILGFAIAGLAAAGGLLGHFRSAPALAQGTPARQVSVEVATAEKRPVPVQISSIGTVTPIASVALKSRIETIVSAVHFTDGALVKKGDLLFTLDGRQVEALLAQARGSLAKDRAQLGGAERDLKRFADLIAKGATAQVNLDNATTQVEQLRGAVMAGEAALNNLEVQKTYSEIRAPISGRISAASIKEGNFVRPADSTPLATINQMSPIYVAFAIPQSDLPALRKAVADGTDAVSVTVSGADASEEGRVAVIDNTVDIATGMVMIRAIMANAQEQLWPGSLVNTTLTTRIETAVIVPAVAVQRSQKGDFVFLIENGVAAIHPVTVRRQYKEFSVIDSGLSGGEQVVTDGQLLLTDGTHVTIRKTPRSGS